MKLSDSENPHLPDELLIVRHSGEIPEVALHGSIYFLTRDPAGPGITLAPAELNSLKKMVVARYREIINRDLDPNNRDKTSYRGLARCLCNWQRLKLFCQKEGIATDSFRRELARALPALLEKELCESAEKQRPPAINCSVLALTEFIEELEIAAQAVPAGWQELCCPER